MNSSVQPGRKLSEDERKIVMLALRPNLYRTFYLDKPGGSSFYDFTTSHMDREILRILEEKRETKCDTIYVFTIHRGSEGFEHYVAAVNTGGKDGEEIWAYTPNLHSPFNKELVKRAHENIRMWSFWRGLYEAPFPIGFLFFTGIPFGIYNFVVAANSYAYFWGGMIFLAGAGSIWDILVTQRRKYKEKYGYLLGLILRMG